MKSRNDTTVCLPFVRARCIVDGKTKKFKNHNKNVLQKPDIFKNTNTKLAKSCIFLSSVGQDVNIV